jgi:hypothetical protein
MMWTSQRGGQGEGALLVKRMSTNLDFLFSYGEAVRTTSGEFRLHVG